MVSRVRGAFSAALLFLMLALAAVPVAEAHTRLPGSQIDRYILPGDAVFPEGIAYQRSTGDFFVSSTTDGTIYRGNVAQRTAQPFLPGNTDGRTTATGLKIDRQGRLFVCGAGSGLIFVYDTQMKALLAKLDTGSKPTTFINDVALTHSGDAYVTDSLSPYLYRVSERAPNEFQLERLLDLRGTPVDYSTPGFKLNGIVATRDGRFLITVQSNRGQLFRIDLATKTIMPIDVGGATVFGDGLQTWVKRYPGFHMDKDTAPVLITTETKGAISMWQPYAELRYLKKPVEMVVVNTDEHVLSHDQRRGRQHHQANHYLEREEWQERRARQHQQPHPGDRHGLLDQLRGREPHVAQIHGKRQHQGGLRGDEHEANAREDQPGIVAEGTAGRLRRRPRRRGLAFRGQRRDGGRHTYSDFFFLIP